MDGRDCVADFGGAWDATVADLARVGVEELPAPSAVDVDQVVAAELRVERDAEVVRDGLFLALSTEDLGGIETHLRGLITLTDALAKRARARQCRLADGFREWRESYADALEFVVDARDRGERIAKRYGGAKCPR